MELLKKIPMPDEMDKKEIMDLLLTEEYGYLPPPPISVSVEQVSCLENFCAGKAVLRELRMTCQLENGSFSFPLYYTRPMKVRNVVPCFIHMNFRPDVPDRYQPTEELVDNGYAIFSFCSKQVTSDDADFTNGLAGIVYPKGKRTDTQCGKLGLWAWAALRVFEYAFTLPEINKKRISVVGHSRLGKTALLVGALEERLYCAFSNDSGWQITAAQAAHLTRQKKEHSQ